MRKSMRHHNQKYINEQSSEMPRTDLAVIKYATPRLGNCAAIHRTNHNFLVDLSKVLTQKYSAIAQPCPTPYNTHHTSPRVNRSHVFVTKPITTKTHSMDQIIQILNLRCGEICCWVQKWACFRFLTFNTGGPSAGEVTISLVHLWRTSYTIRSTPVATRLYPCSNSLHPCSHSTYPCGHSFIPL